MPIAPAAPPPSSDEVLRIAQITDPVERNYAITRGYAALVHGFRTLLPATANWCAFATWASRQAGQSIRHEDLIATLHQRLRDAKLLGEAAGELLDFLEARDLDLGQTIVDALAGFGPLRRSGEALARGNQLIFSEMGSIFAKLIGYAQPLATLTDAQLDAAAEVAELRRTLRHYRAADLTADPKARAELVLLANLQIGLEEQIHVQPQIQQALDAALLDPDELTQAVLDALGHRASHLGHALLERSLLHRAVRRIAVRLREEIRQIITRKMMTLFLPPDQMLRLGQDVTRPFPVSLRAIANAELRELIERFDTSPDLPIDSASSDWASLDQRMCFIATVFRSYQEDEALFTPPFPA